MIDIINSVYEFIDSQLYYPKETNRFEMLWELPLLLFVLGKTLKLNIHNFKILKIMDELNPMVCSLYPLLHINRAYLLVGIKMLTKYENFPSLEEHAQLLTRNIDVNTILKNEFSSKKLSIKNGLCGAAMIMTQLINLLPDNEDSISSKMLMERILTSEIWKDEKDLLLTARSFGQLSGLSGIGTLLLLLAENKKEPAVCTG